MVEAVFTKLPSTITLATVEPLTQEQMVPVSAFSLAHTLGKGCTPQTIQQSPK